MTFRYRHRKLILLVSVILVLVVGGGFFFGYKYRLNRKDSSKNIVLASKDSSKEESTRINKVSENFDEREEDAEYYKVDIKGEVLNPGLYSMKAGSRVDDVIKAAGGLLETSDITVINLSKKIKDEMVIIIYSKDEVLDFAKTREVEEQVISACVCPNDDIVKNDACIDSESVSNENVVSNGKVSINSADINSLMTLTGIGEGKALNIIKYREENGAFQSIEDLKKVDGIGDSLFDKIKENITL